MLKFLVLLAVLSMKGTIGGETTEQMSYNDLSVYEQKIMDVQLVNDYFERKYIFEEGQEYTFEIVYGDNFEVTDDEKVVYKVYDHEGNFVHKAMIYRDGWFWD